MEIDLGLTKLTVNPATQADVWQALNNNTAFPDRDITIGNINAQYSSGTIPLSAGGGAGVSLTASFSVMFSRGRWLRSPIYVLLDRGTFPCF